MICPKCGNQQEQNVQCESCGIYFEKYRKVQQEKDDLALGIKKNKKQSSGSGKILIGLMLLCVIALFMIFGDDESAETTVTEVASVSQKQIEKVVVNKNSVKQRLSKSHPPKNVIEAARNATVFIQTEWGSLGSGFIVDGKCHVITNRHVVEFDGKERFGKVVGSGQYQVAIIRMQQEIISEITRLNLKYREVVAREGKSRRSEEIKSEIEGLKAELEDLPETLNKEIKNELDSEADKFSYADIKVSLVDGTEYSVSQIALSEKYDLATFKLSAVDCPFISRANPDELAQGERLFTIGNPSGLTYTVTSGVFSGFRNENEKSYLQTDAPINPGNSGGPLINEKGKVIGINTLALRKAQNIGFAIPVTSIKDAF